MARPGAGRAPPGARRAAAARLRRGSGPAWEEEFALDGDVRTFRLTAAPLEPDRAHLVLLVEDVTLAKRLERQMLLTERLTTAGRLAAGVAHELNNPLATIAGCAEALLARAREEPLAGLPALDDFRDYLGLIEEETYRCKEITGSLPAAVRELARRGHEVEGAADGEQALARLGEGLFDVLVLDMKMPRREGLDVLRALAAQPEAPQVIVMTGFQDVATAVEAMKLGAYDYLTQPARIEELDVLIRKAAEKAQLLRDNRALRAHADPHPFGPILTRSPRMQAVLRIVERVAPTDSAVLVLGESGTGKELVARAIHERSPRAGRPFVPIHCGALPREVLESELLGHERGAFTGAVSAKPGLIELADGGTLFLDEIGETEPDSQVKSLRVLETGTFFRVGGTRARRVDVRVVAATNRDLAEAMKAGQFRQDLYYRINTITLALPPLRERTGDVPLLARHFLESYAAYGARRLSPAALEALERYH